MKVTCSARRFSLRQIDPISRESILATPGEASCGRILLPAAAKASVEHLAHFSLANAVPLAANVPSLTDGSSGNESPFIRRNRDGLMRRVNVGRLKCFINTRHGGGTEGGLSPAPDARAAKLAQSKSLEPLQMRRRKDGGKERKGCFRQEVRRGGSGRRGKVS